MFSPWKMIRDWRLHFKKKRKNLRRNAQCCKMELHKNKQKYMRGSLSLWMLSLWKMIADWRLHFKKKRISSGKMLDVARCNCTKINKIPERESLSVKDDWPATAVQEKPQEKCSILQRIARSSLLQNTIIQKYNEYL